MIVSFTILLAVVMLVAGICGILSWCRKTAGEIVIAEGIRENTLITVKNIYLKDNFIYYTVVNKSRFPLRFGLIPAVQKKRGNEWIHTSFWYGGQDDFGIERCEPFESVEKCFELKHPENAEPGDYRLVLGEYRTDWNKPPSDDYFYIVGYFTVTEAPAQ